MARIKGATMTHKRRKKMLKLAKGFYGMAELALELMVERSQERKTFGRYLHQHGSVAEWIARSRMEIEQARLLVLKTAWMIDEVGARVARKEISMIKAVVPTMHLNVVDRAIQVFGAMGLTPDSPLAVVRHLPRLAIVGFYL